jgi:hypothetical protein
MLQRFYHYSAQSNVRSKSAQRLHEDTFTQQHLQCQSSEVSGWSLQDSKHWLLVFHLDIEGAKILGNMGFEPQGENLSLIMVKTGKGKNAGRYIIETRMDDLVKELNSDENRITGVSHKSAAWNVKMMATTALLCTFSITPYIYLNLGANDLNISTTLAWLFPGLRATGGFITATLIQLLIQQRITILSDRYLVKRIPLPNPDVD